MLLVILLISIAQNKPISPKKVTDAINCGGRLEVRSSIGVKFRADENEESVDYYTKPQLATPHVKWSEDTALYMAQRQSEGTITYPLRTGTLKNEQTLVLIMKFTEQVFEEVGARVFSIALGDRVIVHNLDVFQKVGFSAAHDEYLKLQFSKGAIYFQGVECNEALRDGHLIVNLIPITEKAMISAVLLFRGSLADTDFDEIENQRRMWEIVHGPDSLEDRLLIHEEIAKSRKEETEKKQSIIKIKNGFQHEIEEKVEQPIHTMHMIPEDQYPLIPPFTFGILFAMLKTPLGIIMFIGWLSATFVITSFVFFDPYGIKKRQEEQQRYQQVKEE